MIRRYGPDDLEAVLRIWAEASAVGHPFLSDDFLAAERENIADVYLAAAETWVWEAEGRVAGFLSLMDNDVGGLFVDPAHHGRGIARALVGHARGLRQELEVEVFRDNKLARSFYSACGFVEVTEGVHAETGLDVVRMKLS